MISAGPRSGLNPALTMSTVLVGVTFNAKLAAEGLTNGGFGLPPMMREVRAELLAPLASLVATIMERPTEVKLAAEEILETNTPEPDPMALKMIAEYPVEPTVCTKDPTEAIAAALNRVANVISVEDKMKKTDACEAVVATPPLPCSVTDSS
jgi:hypothetical protein